VVVHPIDAVYNEKSEILILGSFPSAASRENMFFYGHPANRFWKVISALFDAPLPKDISEKKEFLLSHGIALWDVIKSCDIDASSDSSIRNVIPNDITTILEKGRIKRIFTNGKTAQKYFDKYIAKAVNRESVCLPSTSPANAAYSLEKLIGAWGIIKDGLTV